jgi:hypothetical protein
MLRVLTWALLLGCAVAQAADAPTAEIQGVWRGPWYRGMTSGIMTLEISSAGNTVTFSNLDNFGEATVALRNAALDEKGLSFRAVGSSPQELEATLTLSKDGAKLRGFGKYEGFKLRMEIEKQP